MAYINFKEEIAAAETELRKRKENNNKLIKTIENDLTKIELYPDEKYSFKTKKWDEFLHPTFLNSPYIRDQQKCRRQEQES